MAANFLNFNFSNEIEPNNDLDSFLFEKCQCTSCGRDSLRVNKKLFVCYPSRHNGKSILSLCQEYGFCSFDCVMYFKNVYAVRNKIFED